MNLQIAWNAAARYISLCCNFFIVLAVSRSLGPVAKGESTIWITSVFTIVFAANVAGGMSLVTILKKEPETPVLFSSYIWALICALIIVPPITFFLNRDWRFGIYIISISLMSAFVAIHQNILFSNQRYKQYNILNFAQPALLAALLFFQLYWLQKKDFTSFIHAYFGSVVFTLILSIYYITKIKNKLFSITLKPLGKMLSKGFFYQFAELLQLLHLRLYFYILAGYGEGGLYRLGIYSVGISILEAVWILPRSAATINFAATLKKADISTTFRWLRQSLFISFVFLVAIFLLPVEVYGEVFGEGFLYVKYAVKYLFPGTGIYVFVIVLGSYLMAKEKYSVMIAIHLLGILVSVTLCSVWAPQYEMSGAGMAATVSFALSSLFIVMYFIVNENIRWRDFLIKRSDLIIKIQ
ncbi:MAG: hypothetical protein RMJ53_08470 [Chitinophagales bacterium]|nr:hypothetical protein [Chitinophagales bacterium]MDW8274244.1 hypothetical protein [Chitinophagales bacterium]